jgi:hypothetical protein
MGAVFTREILDKCPRHDHGCGLPHVDGKCAREALVSTAMGMTEELASFSEHNAIVHIHTLVSGMKYRNIEARQSTWLEIAGLALRQATKEPEKPIPLFPVGDVKP